MNLPNYKNADITKEIMRRTQAGSDMIARYYVLGGLKLSLYKYSDDYFRSKIKLGSKREQTLKYQASDKELMTEIQNRIMKGEYDSLQELKMMINELSPIALSKIEKP